MKWNASALALVLVNSACAIQDGAEVPVPCTEHERLEYATTVLGHVVQNWNQPRNLAGVTCVLRIIQNEKGEVLRAKFQDCPADDEIRESLTAALSKAQPLPKPSNPSCFNEVVTWSLEPPAE